MRERTSPGTAVPLGWAGVELKEVKPQSAALPWPDPPSELGILRPFLPWVIWPDSRPSSLSAPWSPPPEILI